MVVYCSSLLSFVVFVVWFVILVGWFGGWLFWFVGLGGSLFLRLESFGVLSFLFLLLCGCL